MTKIQVIIKEKYLIPMNKERSSFMIRNFKKRSRNDLTNPSLRDFSLKKNSINEIKKDIKIKRTAIFSP
jgi:hypothetical protein